MKYIPALFIALLFAFDLAAQPAPPVEILPGPSQIQLTNSVTITWQYDHALGTNESFIVWSGTSSGNYFTNWQTTSTNFVIPNTFLSPGTNYFSVTYRLITTNEAVMSDHSNEIRIIRKQSFPVILSFDLYSSTNLTSWSPPKNIKMMAIDTTSRNEYFKGQLRIEKVERNEFFVLQ